MADPDPELAECWNELRPVQEAPQADPPLYAPLAEEMTAKVKPVAVFPMRTPTNARETDRLMHVLWTKAVGTPGYDKAEWKALEAAIWALMPSGPDR